MPDAVHGFRAVQIAPPAAPQARMVRPGTAAAPGQILLPAARRGSAQLLRPGVDRSGGTGDTYQAMLDGLSSLAPGTPGVPQNLFSDLVPDPSVADMIPKPHALFRGDEGAKLPDDITDDAWGAGRPMLVSVPLNE